MNKAQLSMAERERLGFLFLCLGDGCVDLSRLFSPFLYKERKFMKVKVAQLNKLLSRV